MGDDGGSCEMSMESLGGGVGGGVGDWIGVWVKGVRWWG